jgi:putative membrane protein
MEMLLTWLLSSTAIFLTSRLVDDFRIKDFKSAFIVSAVVGLLNMTLKPILFVLTLPINILTLGLFTFIVNAIILKVAAKALSSFSIRGWMPAIIGGIVLSLISIVLHSLFGI